MKHYKNINGSLIVAVLPVALVIIVMPLTLLLPYAQAITILIVPLSFVFVGNILVLASKWKNIMNGQFTLLGPSHDKGVLRFMYRAGYVLILIGLALALTKLF